MEPLLLLNSMPRLTDSDLVELHEIQDRIEGTDDVEEFLVLDRQLHWTSYRRHDTALLASMIERLWDTTQHYRREFMRISGGPRSWITNTEHRLLFEALERRDAKAAEDVLTLHIRRTRAVLEKHAGLLA